MTEAARPGTIAWTDLTVADADGIRDFYAAVAGWKPESCGMGDYSDYNMVPPGAKEGVAGICHARGVNANMPAQWMIYIVVPRLGDAIRRAVELGGTVVDGPRPVSGQRFCAIRDPAGAVAGFVGA